MKFRKVQPDTNVFAVKKALQDIDQGGAVAPHRLADLDAFNKYPERDELISLMRKHQQLEDIQSAAYKKYSVLAGEVEARTVEKRSTGDTGNVPTRDADVPYNEQTLNFLGVVPPTPAKDKDKRKRETQRARDYRLGQIENPTDEPPEQLSAAEFAQLTPKQQEDYAAAIYRWRMTNNLPKRPTVPPKERMKGR